MKKNILILIVLTLFLSQCSSLKFVKENKSWDDFDFPEIDFVNVDSLGNGLYYDGFIPEPEKLIRETAVRVSKHLYKSVDDIPEVSKIQYNVFNFPGISFKDGNDKNIFIGFSSQYMKNQVDMGTTKKVIMDEVIGVLTHEMTHAYQGNCQYKDDGWSVIEGIADAVRYKEGYFDINERRKIGGNYNGGYTTTGFFIIWITETKDENFLYRLNEYVSGLDEFFWKPAMQELMNEDVEDLWNEYQKYLITEK